MKNGKTDKKLMPTECLEKIEDFCVLVVDKNKKIIAYSKGCERIEEMKREDAIGKNPNEIYEPNDPDKAITLNDENRSLLLNTLKDGRCYKDTFSYYKTQNGKECTVLFNSFPVFDESGNIEMSVGTYREISEYFNLIDTINKKNHDNGTLSAVKLHNNTQYTFEDIIGESNEMKQCIEKAKLAGTTDVPIMISGATGTGKEVFAQSIHNISDHKKNHFVAVNCSAIPENLLESTLFGVRSGSFTGAKERKGLFEEAEGGTLFLDELNSMNINIQSKLLRVLEEKRFRRVGGNKEIIANVRIIAAINQDPLEAIKENRLRSDLYYRLSVFNLQLPPLKNRKEDIIALSNHYISEVAAFLGKKVNSLSKTSRKILLQHDWPGNIRELRHVITQSLYLAGNDCYALESSCLPEYLLERYKVNEEKQMDSLSLGTNKNLREMVDNFEKETIIKALRQKNHNVTQAAKLLNISRQNLQNKMRKYKISG